jgi:hypothetical protein
MNLPGLLIEYLITGATAVLWLLLLCRATTLIYKSGEFPKPIAVSPIRDPDHSCHQRRERRQKTASLPELHVSAASDV